MSENFIGVKRTHYCGEITKELCGSEVTVCGWASRVRDLGGLIFIDLRDRTGIVQCVFNKDDEALFNKAFGVRAEYVLSIRGRADRRGGAVNEKLATGEFEITVAEMRILAAAQTPPFEVVEDSRTNDELRLKYRYLDLRRPDMQKNIIMRSKVASLTRNYFHEKGFLEIETPMLIGSTPEGARDYLVPSRVHKGKFYALPQSPQIYKQLLMLAGYDRYIQIARCFRDEDLRADRQPEFTQIDLEMSFINMDEIFEINEGFLKALFKDALDVDIETPFPRLTYKEAMERFGSDKPDTRFGFELTDLTDIVKDSGFSVFSGAAAAGGSVRGINVKGGAALFSRKEIDKLTEFVKVYRAKGLAWIRLHDETSSSFLKFLSEQEKDRVLERLDAQAGDVLFIVADRNETVFDALGALRCECASRMGLIDKTIYNFLWVTEFPLLEYDEEESRYAAKHHPFTAPMEEDMPLIDTAPGSVRAKAYDIILNGTELGGGSMRIYQNELQKKMFSLLGFTEESAEEQFGFLMEAFKYGTPPHAGIAYGFDRLVMLMLGEDSIRDVIAFPKQQNAAELMTACPSVPAAKQLEELHIRVTE